MKILIVMNYKADWGGLAGAVEELVTSLKKEGFSVTIASTHGTVRERIKNILHIFKTAPRYDFIMATGCGYYGFLPIFIGVVAAAVYKKKVLVDFHEGYPQPFMRRAGKIIKLFLGKIPVVAASHYLFNILAAYRLRAFHIPLHFHYEDFPRRRESFKWNKKFIWVGSFQYMYDPQTAFRACQKVLAVRNDIEFYFFGTGPLLNRLKKQYAHPNIICKGFIPRSSLLKEYQLYCALINTSFGDNFPLRLIEAGCNELLVLTAQCAGPATIYNDQECLFFEKGDHEKLSEYILQVADQPHRYDALRANMHRKAMSFTWEKVKDDWMKLLLC